MPRRFQFSLRTLLWLMLCVGCFFGGMAVNEHSAKMKEAEAMRQGQIRARLLRASVSAKLREASQRNADLIKSQRASVEEE
jgi:hypothetical protein